MDVSTRIEVGDKLFRIRNYQNEIENLTKDSDFELTEVNKILTDNGEMPVTIEEIMKEDGNMRRVHPSCRRYR